jgi:HlyD family secretion protein
LVAALVVVAGLGFWMYRSRDASANVSDKDLLTVQQVDYPVIISATGTLEASQSVDVGPPQVRRQRRFKLMRMVDEGTQVSEGDFLMEFDTTDINNSLRDETANFQKVQEQRQQNRASADTNLKQLKLQLEQAKSDLEKLEVKLSEQAELLSGIQVEETRIDRDAAKTKVELMEKKVQYVTESGQLSLQISRSSERYSRDRMDDLMDAIDSYTVRAPVSGVVIYKRDWNNEAKEVGSDIFGMDKVMEIPDLSTMRAKVQIDELDSGKVKIGQEANITVDAVQGRSFTGKITSVGTILKQATYDRPQKINEIYVDLTNMDTKVLRPGMSLKAQIRVGQYPKAVVIPLASITERNGRSFVQVYNAKTKKADWREVQLKSNDGTTAVVESGLAAGEKIRTRPQAS